jgi:hypothetical protein
METTAFPITKDQASELYGYCTIIIDHLRPFLNTDPLQELHSEELYMTLINTKPLVDEILQTPEQKFDAFSEGLKNYKPKSDQIIDDNTLEYLKGFVNNNRYESILKTALASILPRTVITNQYEIKEAINTAFIIANEVEVKYQELDDLKKQVQDAE